MRKLLNTLFILSDDAFLSFKNENVIIKTGDNTSSSYPLQLLENILSFSHKSATPELLGECASHGVGVAFLSPKGRLLSRTSGMTKGNVLLRRQQYRIADSPSGSCSYARNFIVGKIYNARSVVSRMLRDHPMNVPTDTFQSVVNDLAVHMREARLASDNDTLRGIEGDAARVYFSVFGDMILQGKDTFSFHERVRRPPDSPVNALLSFAYTILSNDCASALESVGLDAYVGFLHTDRSGRVSLALDLMEELRSIFADRFVLTLINKRIMTKDDFASQESGGIFLSDEGRKKFLKSWQEKKHETITHPYLQEKLPWGLVPFVQALLLARTIRGDLPEYPSFLWK